MKNRAALFSTLWFRRPAYPVSLTARIKFPLLTACDAFGDLFRQRFSLVPVVSKLTGMHPFAVLQLFNLVGDRQRIYLHTLGCAKHGHPAEKFLARIENLRPPP